jgi:hypothetical protein
MTANLCVYDGELDKARKVLTLSADAPNCADGCKTMAKYRDVIEPMGENHRTMTSFVQAEVGSWRQFMKVDYYRAR